MANEKEFGGARIQLLAKRSTEQLAKAIDFVFKRTEPMHHCTCGFALLKAWHYCPECGFKIRKAKRKEAGK